MRGHDSGRDERGSVSSYRLAPPHSETSPDAEVQDALETAGRAEGGLSLVQNGKHREDESPRSKYQDSVRQFKPIRSTSKHQHPVDNAGLFSFMTFNWLTPLVVHAHKKRQLLLEDVWPVSPRESCHVNRLRLTALWESEVRLKGDQASLCKVVWSFCRTRLLLSILCLTVTQLAGFSGPAFVVRRLLEYTQREQPDLLYGLLLVLGLLTTELVRSWSLALTWALNYRTGSRLRAAFLSMAFQKILRLRSIREKSLGQLVNMCSSDGQRMFEAAAVGSLLAGGPLVAVLGMAYNLFILGPTSLLGSAVFILFYPTMMFSSRLTAYFRRKVVAVTDRRVQKMNEILNNIKFIKMYAWVKAFCQDIRRIREEEQKLLEQTGYFQSITVGVAPIVVVIASVATFSAHMLLGYDLTAAQAFTVVTVFNAMTFALKVTPFSVKSLSEGSVAIERFKSLFLMSEVEMLRASPQDPCVVVEMRDVSLAWEISGPSVQSSPRVTPAIDATARNSRREKCADRRVLQEEVRGSLLCGGDLASDPEEEEEEESPHLPPLPVPRLHSTLHCINLTIQQGKLVGVCGSVGSGKTSLISAILGQMTLLEGRVAVRGDFAYVSQQPWILNATLRDNILFGKEYQEDRYKCVVSACCLRPDLALLPDSDLTEIGERGANLSGGQRQRVSLARALYSDRDIYILDDPLSALDAHVGNHIFNNAIRKQLCNKTIIFITHQLQYLVDCDEVILMREGSIVEQGNHDDLMSLNGDYAAMFNNLQLGDTPYIEAPGRKQGGSQRKPAETKSGSVKKDKPTSQDNGQLVEECGRGAVSWQVYSAYMRACGGPAVCLFILLLFLLNVGSTAFCHWWLSYWIKQGSGNTTVLVGNSSVLSDSMKDNPMMHQYTAVYASSMGIMLLLKLLRGVVFVKSTLRASSRLHEEVFQKILRSPMKFFDTTPSGRILNRFSKDMDEVDTRLPFQAEMFIQNVILVFCCLAVISCVFPWFMAAHPGPGHASCLRQGSRLPGQLTGLFQFTVRLASETEARFTSVERIQHYNQSLSQEAPARRRSPSLPAEWPQQGEVVFEEVEMRYQPNLPLILKRISCTIRPKEKVGIVGRTGSGKSSLGVVLFRLVELCGGSIRIDGVNICDIGLADLRSKLSIIPQEPVLFSGTVRSNLDPFAQYGEEQVWDALDRTHMKDCVSQLPLKLESEVLENGENFSVGERQLLCVARALLRQCKVLILDEATAAMDTETDTLIQETIRNSFQDCTTLTIAHRLHTILNCDRIMVLNQGKVVEFDEPSKLLANENSRLSAMLAAVENKISVRG
ncbi:multidrug resistance-associated protein 5 isoform X2 [Lampris incognitus]|uniref:multidrug resistance-associated protein 5 isoform X2 n=1 Tax=Lampris incognitus TaxID=2546036 RepID=UPI0024B59523|nr:multidrug resistance-associated protein 5 isoform X2 [Lampris incognitus]